MLKLQEYEIPKDIVDEIIRRYKNSSVFAFDMNDFVYAVETELKRSKAEYRNKSFYISPNSPAWSTEQCDYTMFREMIRKHFHEYIMKGKVVYSKKSKNAVKAWYNEPVIGTMENPNI